MIKKYIVVFFLCFLCLSVSAYSYDEYISNQNKTDRNTQIVFESYLETVKAKLEKNWIAPDFISNGHAKIIFKLDKNGYVISANIIESSKNELFDESAIYALQKSEPFGNFPQNTNRETLTVQYSFNTNETKNEKNSDIKRLHAIKRFAEIDNSSFAYFYLANCYQRVDDIHNAIQAIDKAISLTKLNEQYKRYKLTLLKQL